MGLRQSIHKGSSQPTDGQIIVQLPTQSEPHVLQTVIGKRATIEGIEEFRGIPYGRVPGRWQHAVLLGRLPQDVFDATRNGPRCPQPAEPNNSDFYQSHLEFPGDVEESEFDCLNLFITRPSATALAAAGIHSETTKLPVYAYIHGGAYAFGAGTDPIWDPARLVAKSIALGTPIIVATINYRLNLFGFAASSEIIHSQPDAQVKGCNFGLGDQRTALRWIHQNISAFGGDPSKLTLGGQSAGGSSSHAHVLEAIRGKCAPLLQRGIIQSGAIGVLGPISMESADAQWDLLCKQVGAPADDADVAVRMKFMSTVPAAEILKANETLGWTVCPLTADNRTISQLPNGSWNVHLSGSDEPTEDVAERNTTEVSVLIGDTEFEGTIHYHQVTQIKSFEQLDARLTAAIPSKTFLDEFYTVYSLNGDFPLELLHKQLFRFLSDQQFGYPVQRAREELLDSESSLTQSDEDGSTSKLRPTRAHSYRIEFGNPFPGINYNVAQHCVDLIYIYDAFHDALRAVDDKAETSRPTNSDLVDCVQSDWIRFIASPVRDDGGGLATVYAADRTVSVVDMASDEKWVARLQRFDFLDKYRDAVALAAKALTDGEHIV